MILVASLLVAASGAFAVARATRFTPLPLLLAAGVVLQAISPELDRQMLEEVISLGLAFLLFRAGAEMDERRTRDLGPAVMLIGLGQFIGLGTAAFAIAWLWGSTFISAVFVALAVAASSSLIATRLLRQRQQFFEPFGRLTLGVLLLQTILSLLALAALTRLGDGSAGMESAMFRGMALGVIGWVTSRSLTPWLLVKQKLDDESLLISVLAILFAFLGLAWALHLPLAVGAFCAGYALSPFPANGIVRNQLDSLNVFFLALFFTAVGAELSLLTTSDIALGMTLATLVIVFTPLWVTWLGHLANLTRLVSIEVGLLLAQTSEISLVIAIVGRNAGLITDAQFSSRTLCAVVTMGATPWLSHEASAHRIARLLRIRPHRLPSHTVRDHFVILGCGPNTFPILEDLLAHRATVAVIDDDPGVIDRVHEAGAIGVLGDATSPQVLDAVCAADARAVLSTLRRPSQHRQVMQHLPSTPVIARVFSEAERQVLESIGGEALALADLTVTSFLTWFDRRTAQERPAPTS